MIGYAGFRAAKAARDTYAKLLAAGVTSLILAQAVLNFFAVMGLAPLTGVPLPFVSYGNSNLIVLLGAMGLLLGVAAKSGAATQAGGGRKDRDGRRGLRAIEGGRGADSAARSADGGRRAAKASRSADGGRRAAKASRKAAGSRRADRASRAADGGRRAAKASPTTAAERSDERRRREAARADRSGRDGGTRRAGARDSRRAAR
jgi:hypothetical protein